MKSFLYFLTRFGDVIDFASATEPHTFCSSPFLRRYLHLSNPSVHGSSILSAACHISNSDRCLDIVEILVSRGALVNSCNCYNHTPLMEAAGVGKVEVLKYLVERGAIIDACDKGGFTALFYGAASNSNSVDALLLLGSGISCISADTVEPLWREALTLREKCSSSTQLVSPIGGQIEMHTTADLDPVMSSRAEMQYQSWIIKNRCLGTVEPNVVIGACVHAVEMFKSCQYSEAEFLLKHVLTKLVSRVQCLPPDMRAYELNHSAITRQFQCWTTV